MPMIKKFTLEGGCSHSHRKAVIPVFEGDDGDDEMQLNPVDDAQRTAAEARGIEYVKLPDHPHHPAPSRSVYSASSVHPRRASAPLSSPPLTSCGATSCTEDEVKKRWDELPLFFDSHLHLVNFVQDEGPGGITGLMAQMDLAKVEKAVLLGMGVCKKWSKDDTTEPTYYTDDDSKCYFYSLTDQIVLDAVSSLNLDQQKRFAPLIGGINPTDKHAIKHVKRMYEKAPRLWRGVGELLLRHDDLTNLTIDQEAGRADHPALQPIFDFCSEKNLPVLIHQNCTNIQVKPDPTAELRYFYEMEACVKRNPNLTIVWAHCGVSRRVGSRKLEELIDQMLTNYSNLNVDISWVVLEDEIMDPDTTDKNPAPKHSWVTLIEKFPTRVLIGSDVVSTYSTLKDTLRRYSYLLCALKQGTAANLVRGNAERIFFSS